MDLDLKATVGMFPSPLGQPEKESHVSAACGFCCRAGNLCSPALENKILGKILASISVHQVK
jgi:hypothetical protein